MRNAIALGAALAAAALASPPGAAAEEAPPSLFGIRPLGMGNAFVAVNDDRNALYYNPAGLASLERTRVSGLGAHAAIDDEFLEVVRFVQDHEEQFSDFSTIDAQFWDDLAPFDDRWVAADANAYVDLTRPGFGLGAYSAGRLQFKIDRGVYEPRVHASVTDDIVALVGGAMPLGRADLDVGAAVKAIWRRQSNRALTAREVADFDPADVLGDLERAESGFSMDLGAAWRPGGGRLRAGAVLRDAAGFVGGRGIDTAFDVGVALTLAEDAGPVRRVLVAADGKNVFQGDQAFARKLDLGAEVAFPLLAVRGGFHQGYGTFGASLGLPILAVDYAYYGRELGAFPGAEGQFLHAVEARLGF